MSHGGGDDSIEPDLTPLLDLVMQLLMFFIVSVRFVKEQVHQDVQLPESSSAQLVKKADKESLFINLKANRGGKGVVLVKGKEPMDLLEAKNWLTDLYTKAEKEAGGPDKVRIVIHLRPDRDLELNELFKMMNFAKAAGFTKVKIRAVKRNQR